jgi:hypothetical protein
MLPAAGRIATAGQVGLGDGLGLGRRFGACAR